VAVLHNDAALSRWKNIQDIPRGLVENLRHYFLTYKTAPGEAPRVLIPELYDAKEAKRIITLSRADYFEKFQNCRRTSAL
jgi:inorganic pyrophosphatase